MEKNMENAQVGFLFLEEQLLARCKHVRDGTGLLLSAGDFVTSSAASVELAEFACGLTQAGYGS